MKNSYREYAVIMFGSFLYEVCDVRMYKILCIYIYIYISIFIDPTIPYYSLEEIFISLRLCKHNKCYPKKDKILDFKGQLGVQVPLTEYPWYLFCPLGILADSTPQISPEDLPKQSWSRL